jgi:hypothetical protein
MFREVDHNYIVLQLQWNLSDPTRQEAREMCRIVQDVRILRFNLVNINQDNQNRLRSPMAEGGEP